MYLFQLVKDSVLVQWGFSVFNSTPPVPGDRKSEGCYLSVSSSLYSVWDCYTLIRISLWLLLVCKLCFTATFTFKSESAGWIQHREKQVSSGTNYKAVASVLPTFIDGDFTLHWYKNSTCSNNNHHQIILLCNVVVVCDLNEGVRRMERGERATVQEQEEQVSECAGGDVRWKNKRSRRAVRGCFVCFPATYSLIWTVALSQDW